MGFEPGDRIRHRDQKGFVLLVHEDGALNVIHGTSWSDNSDGIWPPELRERVDPDDVVPGWEDPEPVDEADEQADDAGDGDAEPEASDGDEDDGEDEPTSNEDPAEPEDTDGEGDEWSPDFDADAFVDRTPMSEVIDDLETGEYDELLDVIEEAEESGRDRDGVADAIEARR